MGLEDIMLGYSDSDAQRKYVLSHRWILKMISFFGTDNRNFDLPNK